MFKAKTKESMCYKSVHYLDKYLSITNSNEILVKAKVYLEYFTMGLFYLRYTCVHKILICCIVPYDLYLC